MTTANAKDLKRSIMIRQLSEVTAVSPADITIAIQAPDTPLYQMFELFYSQVEGLQESNLKLQQKADAQQQRADVAAMRAQEYFVRLRDAGLLNKGETF